MYLCRFIEESFDRFKDHFVLDPLLVRVFVYICPVKDLPSLFERIPPVLSTVWLAHMVKYTAAGIFNKNEVRKNLKLYDQRNYFRNDLLFHC